MNLEAAIIAASKGDRPQAAIDGIMNVKEWLEINGRVTSKLRWGHMIGQSAHESAGFTKKRESLNYSVEGLLRTFSRRRISKEDCEAFGRTNTQPANQRAIANLVYGGEWGKKHLGNTEIGDGWVYRASGWMGLTGRANHRRMSAVVGVNLVEQPHLAADPEIAWKIAAHFLNTHTWGGKTAFYWADQNDVYRVTRIVNGGTNGLEDRAWRTEAALGAL